MKASETSVLKLLKNSSQFVVPVYQRTYSWTEEQCQQLWDDITRTGSNENISAHFVGSIVYVEDGLSTVTDQSPLLVIDGQQRLTTLMLLLEALAVSSESESGDADFSSEKIRNYYLTNNLESGDRFFKLLLTETDRETLKALMKQKSIPENHSVKIDENFKFFSDKLSNVDLEIVWNGISKLVVVEVALDRKNDNPQLIFESMNSTGRELSQADLIRNYVLMGLAPNDQDELYKYYWRPMELEFGQENYDNHFDEFVRYFLIVKTGEQPRLGDLYESFKKYVRIKGFTYENIKETVGELKRFSTFFCNISFGIESDSALDAAFRDIVQGLRSTVSFPLLLSAYDDFDSGVLSKADFLRIVRLVESYIFRRSVCDIQTNSMNKTFVEFIKHVDKDRYLESVMANFYNLTTYRRFPRNDEFLRCLKICDLYNTYSRSYWLRKLENFGKKEEAKIGEYTIEHIMPQNPNLSEKWKLDLGENWKHVHETYLHTLGNLTLTGYNSEYSDKPFHEKRDMEGGFKHSPLTVNEGLGRIDLWNEESIQARAQKLAMRALEVWSFMEIDASTAQGYKKASKAANYSLDNFKYLSDPKMKELFLELREQIFLIDSCVTEEIKKKYIAFKADTNFVDVVPQKTRLRLSFNMPFDAVMDPRGQVRDITNLGKWGNGDADIYLNDSSELPYVMNLVTQAFDYQMSSSVAD